MKIPLILRSITLLFFITVKFCIAQDFKYQIETEMEISSIISTYEANQARFHSQYKGKQLSGRAIVESVTTDVLGRGSYFFINLKTNWSLLKCITTNRNMAAQFDKNQIIKFTGEIDDVVFNRLSLENCSAEIVTVDNLPKLDKSFEKRTLNSKCSLVIYGRKLMNHPCFFKSESDRDIFDDLKLEMVCPNGKDPSVGDGCFGYQITVVKEGAFGDIDRQSGKFCWNDGVARRAQTCFQNLRRTGACWKNSEVEFCAWKK